MKLELRANEQGHWMVVCAPRGFGLPRVVFNSGETGAQGVYMVKGVKKFLAIRQSRAWNAWKDSNIAFSETQKIGS